MADFKLSSNGKANRSTASSAASEAFSESSDLRQDVAAIKEDVIRLAQHLQSNNAHLLEDAKKSLDTQMKKAKNFSRQSLKQVETHVREKPTQSVLVAFGAGLVASILLARR